MLDFSAALPQNDFDSNSGPIPNGTLAWVMVKVRWFNQDQGIVETTSKHTGSQYLDCELTVVGGRHDKRKVFTKIGIYSPNGETYTNMGRSAMKAILEVGVGAGAQNPNGYKINSYADLSGLKAAVRIKIEPGKDGYQDKNDISLWLTPNADSPGAAAEFARLVAGDTEPKAGTPVAPVARAAKPAAPAAPAWGAPAAPAAQPAYAPAPQAAPAAAAPAKPSWL
jgi:hypothetical protein